MKITRIPDKYLFPASLNTHPSIAEYGGERWMTYRLEQSPRDRKTRVVICKYDIGPVRNSNCVLCIPLVKIDGGDEVVEDARLFHCNGELWLTATNRQHVGIGMAAKPSGFRWLDVPNPQLIEKNWGFFCHDETLYGIRWINGERGHEIYTIGDKVELAHADEPGKARKWDWAYGEPHGGTCPIRYGNLYVSIFHSYVVKDGIKTYYAAPYAFEAKPPFRVVMTPARPMLWPTIANHHKDYVVFPCGLIRECDRWICTYGDDAACWKAEFSTEELFDVLKPL